MKNVLVFGLSGQVGAALLVHGFGDARLLAVSRRPREAIGGVTWRLGSLEQMPDIGGDFDVILGLGSVPLSVLEERMAQFIKDGGAAPAS